MTVTVKPSTINGIITAPASKSSMQRACALALLQKGETIIHNPGKSNDDRAAIDIIRKLGAEIEIREKELRIKNKGGLSFNGEVNCGESGLGIRMFAAIAALSPEEVIITGEGSLLKRPMHFFDEVLPQLGVSVSSNNGYLPIRIKGPLQPAEITIDGSLSSQFLTGLLMAFGKAATRSVTMTVTNLKSKPYIDLTLQMMNRFGYKVENDKHERFTIRPVDQLSNVPINYTVEGDWSGAAFLLVAGAVAGTISVKGLDLDSTQADKAILNALKDSGAIVSSDQEQIVVSAPPGNRLKGFQFNATDCPDLFPPLVTLAANCSGTTTIRGVHRLLHKESNRSLALQQEFAKMGVKVILNEDEMVITGGNGINAAIVHSHHDHRIAMACAVAGLKGKGETFIEEAEAVNKSYPDFYEHLKMLGATVSLPINK